MKILLISSNTEVSPYPVYPLGMGIIANALTTAGHAVRQIDFLQRGASLNSMGKEISVFKPELIGISIRNIDNVNLVNERYYMGAVQNIVQKIRTLSTARVILGGAGFSLMPELILKETGADYGIVGEGERLIVDFVKNAEAGMYPEKTLLGPLRTRDHEEIRSAAYDEQLLAYYLKSGNIMSVQTKRGCSHRCVYCTYPLLEGRHLRARKADSVVDDIELLRDRYNAKHLFFVDSIFNDDEGYYLKLMEEMMRRKVNIRWTAFFKPDGLNEEAVKLMRNAGLAGAEIGADAACDVTLKKMGKHFTVHDIMACNDLFYKYGISSSNSFMFGGPGETEETVVEGIKNIQSLHKALNFIFMGIRILPNTPLARIAVREAIIPTDSDMLKPVYYISPAVDKEWLKTTLTAAFKNTRHCIFPPDAIDNILMILHKMSYNGRLRDKLIPGMNEQRA
ncbi:MAG: lipid biosynthesis B12-binding/radical SAM protein [Deltaproteobacteria bacterium]|nr:lipid biosynthesis B12-binding/radical SAM protein [Deltaproteobacteria bacterium]